MTKNDYITLISHKLNQQNLDLIPKHYFFYNLWWKNPNPNSMRLTNLGHEIFVKFSDLEKHKYSGKVSNNLQTMLLLDRKLQYPYWYAIDQKQQEISLLFFGNAPELIWLTLYGNLDLFLQQYQVSK